MKKIFFIGCAVSLIFATSACKPKEQTNTANSSAAYVKSDNSENSLDWEGVYMGIIPCADCPGIQVRIALSSGNTYKMDYLYLEQDANNETFEGTFQWDEEGNVITLGNLEEKEFPIYYKVGENLIIQLDTEGREITGQLAANYVLTKIDTNLTDKRWKLTEIMGNPVAETKDTTPAFITFNSENSRVSGNSGCNSFSGTYQLKPGNKLTFSTMVSTRMMCIDMDIENKLNAAFPAIDSYIINENGLILNGKEATPLARFIAEKK
jgi:heat shock protein HslJ